MTVATLASRQRDFMRALFAGDDAAAAGVGVYRSSVLANYVAALAATYPVTRRLVGEAFFAEAARRFATRQPSASGDLGDFGDGFAAFLEGYAPAAPLAYLPDVARLEWACHECARAPLAPCCDFQALAGVAADRYDTLVFTLDPAVRLVSSAHPIAAIHAANAPDRDGCPARREGPDFVVVRRVDGSARVETVPEHEWRFLAALAHGQALGIAFAALPPEIAAGFIEGALARYVASGIFCGFAAP